MRSVEDVRAIPLWINGRACLRLTPAFAEVCDPVSGAVLRRVPVCRVSDVEEVILAAQTASSAWDSLGESRRRQLLVTLGDALEALADHFMKLVAEETGLNDDQAGLTVKEIVAYLRSPNALSVAGVVVATSDSAPAMANLAALAVAALAAGAGVVICPPLYAPSALLALAELSGRCGFPAGVISVVYPDSHVLADLHGRPGLTILSC